MLRLFLLRHGKATKFQDDRTDFERHLNKHGTAQVNQVGYLLREKQVKIGQIISSDAYRAAETAEIVNHFLRLKSIDFDHGLYMARKDMILKKIIDTAKSPSILYVGHNNGISDLAGYLTGQDILMSTSQLLEISFRVNDWQLVSAQTGQLTNQITPDVHSF